MATKIHSGRETGFGGGVLIFAKDTSSFLWIKRSEYGDYPGHWCVPGGGIEDFETIEQGVKREVKEEIGYTGPLDLMHMYRDVQSAYFIFCNHVALVETQFDPVLNEEHTDYKWDANPPQPLHPRLELAISEWHKRHAKAGN